MAGPKPRLHLPYRQWPAADRLLWESTMANDDPFADAAGARLSKASQHDYLFAWRRFLGFLAKCEPTALELAPGERLTIGRIRAFVAHLADTNTPRSRAVQVHMLYLAARMMMPECDWTWLRTIRTRLFAAAPTHAPSGPVITSPQLLDLGLALMDESKPAPDTAIAIKEAVRYRDGLMFALTAFIPLRRKNLAALTIGRHLVREGDYWDVIISGEETKTGASIAARFPEMLELYLTTYLDRIRPQLNPSRDCAALWLNSKGGRLAYAAIGRYSLATHRPASASASPPTTCAMPRHLPGLCSRRTVSPSRASSSRTPTNAHSDTIIERVASQPVECIVTLSLKCAEKAIDTGQITLKQFQQPFFYGNP